MTNTAPIALNPNQPIGTPGERPQGIIKAHPDVSGAGAAAYRPEDEGGRHPDHLPGHWIARAIVAAFGIGFAGLAFTFLGG